MENNSMSPADIAAVVRPNGGYGYGGYPMAYPVMPMYSGFGGFGGYGNGFGMDGSWIWILVLLAMFGGFGNGFGGFGGFGGAGLLDGGVLGYAIGNNATKSDLSELQTSNKIDNLSTQVGTGFANTATQLCSGFADVQSSICNGVNSINTGLLTGFGNSNLLAATNTAGINANIADARYAADKCCCEIREQAAANANTLQAAILNSDNLNFRNTCAIENMIQEQTTAIKADGEATRALIVANKIADLEEKLANKDRELQNARFDASQVAQTAQLINQLQPVSRPAYITASPYQSIFPTNGYGNNFGYGCGNWGWNQFI